MATSLMKDLVIHGLGCRLRVRCVGEAAERLSESMRLAWSWCLDATDIEPMREGFHDAGLLEVRLDNEANLAFRLMTATQEVTLALIKAQAGRLLMLHAGAVSHPRTGAALVYVAPGGTGKTTMSRRMGLRFRYLTDETVGIDAAGGVRAYPKPLSIRPGFGAGPKAETSPGSLGLRSRGAAPQVARIVLLDRVSSLTGSWTVDELGLMEALVSLVGQTSSLPALERPLHRLGDIIEAAGPVLRIRYREAADVELELASLIGEPL